MFINPRHSLTVLPIQEDGEKKPNSITNKITVKVESD